jgi:hypothetical protein
MRRALHVVVPLIVAAGATTAWTFTHGDSPAVRALRPQHAQASIGVTLPSDSGPFPGSKRVTLEEVNARRYARERPDDRAVSDATLTTIWATPRRLAFEYTSGIEVQLQPWGSTAEPASVFSKLAAEFNLRDALTTVGTDPAIAVSLDEASPASIEFVRRNLKITVFGAFPDAVLRRVAETIP